MTGHKKSFLGGFVVCWIAQILYLSSLSVLIPVAVLMILSPTAAASTIPLGAFALLGMSVIIILLYYKNFAKTLSVLGWLSLIPGIAGLFFMIFDPDGLIGFLEGTISWIAFARPFISAWEDALPKLWVFVIGYIFIGLFFIHVAGKIEKQHALVEQVRKFFGKRARILRSH